MALAQNKKAYHNYQILEKIEVGIALTGTEVKSIRAGKVNLKESYAKIIKEEAWLLNCHIDPYAFGNRQNPDPYRDRKLLLHKREIIKLGEKTNQKGLTLVPIALYLSKGRVKLELGLGQAKKLHDKRHSLKDKTIQRDVQNALKTSKQ